MLIYHKVESLRSRDQLTVTVAQLEAQFSYLQQQHFSPISLSILIAHINKGNPLPPKPILISFDDGYRNNFTLLYPLLVKYGFKANIFLVADFVDRQSPTPQESYLNVEDISQMDSHLVEFGLHSFDHKSYTSLTASEIETDLQKMKQRFAELKIDFQPCFAYPYGAFPKRDPMLMRKWVALLQQSGIVLGFRIGNRINRLPFKKKFEIQRIDVKGNDPLWKFKLMCRFGRKWLPF